LFSIIGFPHRDNAAATVAVGPNDNDHAAIEGADGDVALFTVVRAIIRHRVGRTIENLGSVGEVEPMGFEGRFTLGRVEGDLHSI
jgi:hypothetical protein